ncbi:MAG TPA: peptidylprolyl isomerase [Trebonia sp.]
MNAAAMVRDQEITVDEVNLRLAELRTGPLAGRLPHPDAPEGRNLRRWLVQVMAAELLVQQETPALEDGGRTAGLSLELAMRTGGVVAAVLATPAGRALFDQVTATIQADETEISDYYARNLDRFTAVETRWTRELGPVRLGELTGPIEDAVFSAAEGEVVGPVEGPGGPWTITVERIEGGGRKPYQMVREEIRRELTLARREQEFGRWLQARVAACVRLSPGFEHPGDPRQPDAAHRH